MLFFLSWYLPPARPEEQQDADYNAEFTSTSTNSRIRSKSLIRYRLFPTDKCSGRFKMYSATSFTERYGSTSANCYSKCYKKSDANASLCSNSITTKNPTRTPTANTPPTPPILPTPPTPTRTISSNSRPTLIT